MKFTKLPIISSKKQNMNNVGMSDTATWYSPNNYPSYRALLIIIVPVLLASGYWLYMNNRMTPYQKAAAHQRDELAELSRSLTAIKINFGSDDAKPVVLSNFLDTGLRARNQCKSIVAYNIVGELEKITGNYDKFTNEARRMCQDVEVVASYSHEIFSSVEPYIKQSIDYRNQLPGSYRDNSLKSLDTLDRSARTALINIDQTAGRDRELRYAGVPEIKIVLQENIATIQGLQQLIQDNNNVSGIDQSWIQAFAGLDKNQQDILNHRKTFWLELVRLDDLQKTVDEMSRDYNTLLPSKFRQ